MNHPSVPHGAQRAFPYPQSASTATSHLSRFLAEKIRATESIPFQDFMANALYHPEHGYYARPDKLTATKKGDFVTSVSVGPCFGFLLAHRIFNFWENLGRPQKITLVELGAHNGSLARDVLSALPKIDPDLAETADYLISEPLPRQRATLEKNLAPDFPEKLTILAELPRDHPHPIVLLANEVLDALPVPLIHFQNGQWQELHVRVEDGIFQFVANSKMNPSLKKFTETLGLTFSENYLTEGPPDFPSFLQKISDCARKDSLLLFVDYGFDHETLYHPARCDGTLRAYFRHQRKNHPLDRPGAQDLTAHVNFSALAETAEKLGYAASIPMHQGRYLTHLARPWLLSNPTDQKLIQQFQTLTHPNHFGTTFHAIELTRKVLSGTTVPDVDNPSH